MSTETLAFDPVQQALCPLALQMRRVTGSIVGRPLELAAIAGELRGVRERGLTAVTLEGEPGIGKTRLLLAAVEMAESEGFVAIAVSADEELRAPFLLMRSVMASAANQETLSAETREAVNRAVEALSGRDDPTVAMLPPDQRLLRQFDLSALALRQAARDRPLALFVDDLQWADDDSLRALRYLIRAAGPSSVFLVLALRPEEAAFATEAVTLVADMERMGLVRRMKLARLTHVETGGFLRQFLGGEIDLSSASIVHAQAEGVPFILEELMRAYRETGLIQQIDGRWTLSRGAERLVPSAVHTLVQRRAAHLPEATELVLAESAVLGRSFSLRDLRAVRARLEEEDLPADRLAAALDPAAAAGLLSRHPEGSPADYNFTHEQVREFALSPLSAPQRRAVHQAIVDMLTEAGEPSVESLPLLVHHAAAAGNAELCARFSIQSARAALDAQAPEEARRVVEVAMPMASAPVDRVTLLSLRDDALAMLRRPTDRLDGLAELTALADALGDPHIDLQVMLRRSAALRQAEQEDLAADLARRAREIAAERGDRKAELSACLALGQALLKLGMGEGFTPSADGDPDGAEEAYRRAVALAEELGDEANLAAALRELGVIQLGRLRTWFIDQIRAGQQFPLMARSAAGETLDEILATLPIAPLAFETQGLLQRALELFEKLGDRRGVMSTVIAMAYLRFGPDIHLGGNPARRIEEIRRLTTRLHSLTTESERAVADAQMLYGAHVFARAKMIPDQALARGEEAYRAAIVMGDRSLEFLAAGGIAMAHLDLAETEAARTWLDRAAVAAAAAPTPLRSQRLGLWRGLCAAAAGDAAHMREHLERAVQAATEQGRPAARCELLARLAVEAARLGAERGDEELLTLAERSAREAKEILPALPGHPPWGAQADAALSVSGMARGDVEGALVAARAAVADLQAAMREDLYPEILLPVAGVLLAAGRDEERQLMTMYLQVMVGMIAQRTLDEEVRVRWFRGPLGREFVRLVGPVQEHAPSAEGGSALLAVDERRLLGLLTEGLTNREIAERVGATPEAVAVRLQEMFAKVGASSRGEATAFALREGML
jgi:tetratricopeptide (TPR) repeat protein/DNA-binding CsgD family transcriptional regulator